MTPEQLSKGPIFAGARRAFTDFVIDETRRAAERRLDTSGTMRDAMLKVEVLERVSSLAHAEKDLAALLRPDLTEADFAETLARWMLYLAGGDVPVDIALTKVLEAVAPLIEQDLGLRIAAELERQASPDRIPNPMIAVLLTGFDVVSADRATELVRDVVRDTYFAASTVACEVAWNVRSENDAVADTEALHADATRKAMRMGLSTHAVGLQLARTLQAALPGINPRQIGEVLLTLSPMLLGLSHRAAQHSDHPDGVTAVKMANTLNEAVTQGGRILYGQQPPTSAED